MAQKPLMLKDYLELDSCSESSGAGFRCAPRQTDPSAATIRCLLESELCQGGGRLVRSRSRIGLTKISAVINVVKLFPFSSSSDAGGHREGILSRSFSKKLKGIRSWKKRTQQQEEVEEKRVRVKDIVRLRSFEEYGEERESLDFPSLVVSSGSSCSESECSESNFPPSSISSSEDMDENAEMVMANGCEAKKASKPRSTNPNRNPRDRKVVGEDSDEGGGGVPKEIKNKIGREIIPECHSDQEDDKEQFSPVSVMDFPCEEEEEELSDDSETTTSSPGSSPSSFHHSLANIERTRLQLLQKIRRFESLAELVAVELDQRFSACWDCVEDISESGDHHSLAAAPDYAEDHQQCTSAKWKAWGLLGELKASGALAVVAPAQGSIEKLLSDFFIQGLSCSDEDGVNRDRLLLRRKSTLKNAHGQLVEEELLNAAIDWMSRRRSRDDQDDSHGEKALGEMDKDRRWGCFDEEEEELGTELGSVVLRSLLEELAVDLVSSC